MWPMLAMFAVNAGSSLLQGSQQRKQIKAQNKALRQANIANTEEAMYSIGTIRVQQADMRMQAQRQQAEAVRAAGQAAGDARTLAAAAGVKGASVDAVQYDVEKSLDDALAEIQISAINSQFNLNQQIRQVARQTAANLHQYQKVPSTGDILRQSILSGAMAAGQAYAGQFFQFGSTGAGGLGGGMDTALGQGYARATGSFNTNFGTAAPLSYQMQNRL